MPPVFPKQPSTQKQRSPKHVEQDIVEGRRPPPGQRLMVFINKSNGGSDDKSDPNFRLRQHIQHSQRDETEDNHMGRFADQEFDKWIIASFFDGNRHPPIRDVEEAEKALEWLGWQIPLQRWDKRLLFIGLARRNKEHSK